MTAHKTTFRTPQNKLITSALFKEYAQTQGYQMYTCMPVDCHGLPSIQRLYIEMMDVAEFQFAEKYFEGWKHWCLIRDAKWFKSTYKEMRDALEAKMQSLAHQEMLELVYSGKAGHQTLAYLGNKGYLEKEKVGRPNKKAVEKAADEEIKRKAKEQQELDKLIAHDPKLKKLVK